MQSIFALQKKIVSQTIRNPFVRLLFLVLLVSTFAACHRKPDDSLRLRKRSVDFLLEKLNDHNFSPETFSARTKLRFEENGKTTKGDITIRMQRDEKIWLSISPALGMRVEIARAIITPDSIQVMDKFNKIYYAEHFSSIQKFVNYPVDFQSLQALLLGGLLSEETFEEVRTNYGYYVLSSDECSVFMQPETFLMQQLHLYEREAAQSLIAVFSDYEAVEEDSLQFSHQRSYDITAGSDKFGIELQFSKVKVNDELKMPYRIKKNYRRGRL